MKLIWVAIYFCLKRRRDSGKNHTRFFCIKSIGFRSRSHCNGIRRLGGFCFTNFFPKLRINEDPVCGSAHANLIPYWGKRLNQTTLSAYQVSPRGGFLTCEVKENRVIIGGTAKLFAKGKLTYLYKSTPTASNSSLAVGVLNRIVARNKGNFFTIFELI